MWDGVGIWYVWGWDCWVGLLGVVGKKKKGRKKFEMKKKEPKKSKKPKKIKETGYRVVISMRYSDR